MSDAQNIHVRTSFVSRSGRVPAAAKSAHASHTVVRRPPAKSLVVTPRPQKQSATKPRATYKVTGVMDMKTTPAQHVKAHKPQPARTLMRTAVTRPDVSLRRQVHAQTRTDILVKSPQVTVTPKHSIATIHVPRQQHAARVAKSSAIHRFAPEQASWFRQQVSTPAAEQSVSTTVPVHITPAPAATHAVQTAPKASAPATTRSMDIFQRALATATAHEEPEVSPKKHVSKRRVASKKSGSSLRLQHRLSSVVAVSLAVVVLGGFFAYQNKVNITTRFASAKAGFHVTLPASQPQGFAASGFHYSVGQVAINFSKPGTSRNYTLSQKKSNLSSDELLASTVAPHSDSYQIVKQGNKTAYIYGNGQAVWVENGLLYQITSNGNLNNSDLLTIVTSV